VPTDKGTCYLDAGPARDKWTRCWRASRKPWGSQTPAHVFTGQWQSGHALLKRKEGRPVKRT